MGGGPGVVPSGLTAKLIDADRFASSTRVVKRGIRGPSGVRSASSGFGTHSLETRENLEVTMKLKSLLLGAAAGLVATAGAQAADLPVKAKPVEYVKVCSAYGAGFYYIPGTDICLRVGGYVWSEFEVNARGAAPQLNGTGLNRDRSDNWNSWRVRNVMIFDARTNTEYGTLRSYFSVRLAVDDPECWFRCRRWWSATVILDDFCSQLGMVL